MKEGVQKDSTGFAGQETALYDTRFGSGKV